MKVTGQFVFSTLSCVHAAALSGFGFAYLPEDQVKSDLESGALVEVLASWRQTFEGYHLYYPHRRHPSPAFALLADALKARCKRSAITAAPRRPSATSAGATASGRNLND